MKQWIPTGAIVLALAAAVGAQDKDKTVTSETRVEADDATVVTLTGCLRQDAAGHFTLAGGTAAAGDEVKTKTRVETDVDDDGVEVKARTSSKADDAVGTSGSASSYMLIPRGNVALMPHVGRQVQVSAVMLDHGEDDAEVEIKDKTTVDADDAPERTRRSKSEVEIEGVPHGQYTVVSVKRIADRCAF